METAGGNPKPNTNLSTFFREELLEKCLCLEAENTQLHQQLLILSEQMTLANKKNYGPSSEKTFHSGEI